MAGGGVAPKRKLCRECKELLPVESFPPDRAKCHDCAMARRRRTVSSGPEPFLKNLYNQSKYSNGNRSTSKGRKKGAFIITYEDILAIWERQQGRCAISGIVMTHHRDGSGRKDFNASLDRIVPHDDYTKDNVQLVAFRVNLMKQELTEDLFFWWVRTINDNIKSVGAPSPATL